MSALDSEITDIFAEIEDAPIRRKKMTAEEREIAFRVAKVRREAKARADAIGRMADPNFAKREAAYLMEHPHLAAHKHCGFAADSEDRPRRRVVCPNGVILLTTWYKVPTTDEDARRALRETKWLTENGIFGTKKKEATP